MATDVKTLSKRIAPFLTPANILSAMTLVVTVVVYWDVLVLRYQQFVEWAPGVSAAVAQIWSIVISVVVAVVLHTTISRLLELVYFGPLKRLNKLQKETPEKMAELQGRLFCQSVLLSTFATHLTAAENQELGKVSDFLQDRENGPMKKGALEELALLRSLGALEIGKPLADSE